MNYQLEVEEAVVQGGHTYYRTRITNLDTQQTRVVNLKYSAFSNLHSQIEADNPSSEVPLPSNRSFHPSPRRTSSRTSSTSWGLKSPSSPGSTTTSLNF